MDTDDFTPLRIARVVRETADAVSLVLDVPGHRAAEFRYRAGQFLTLRVTVDGQQLRRCYSMSSAPAEDELRITVKRDPGGLVSNWLNDSAAAGDELHAGPPDGRFVLREGLDTADAAEELVAFAGGSGITPIMSLIRTVLTGTSRPVRLFYANRTRDAVIFGEALDTLAEQYPDRFTVEYHYDDDSGVVTPAAIERFAGSAATGNAADVYVCGPGKFMDAVQDTVLAAGVAPVRLHLERFQVPTVPDPASGDASPVTEEVVIVLGGKKTVAPYRAGNTLLQTARVAGLRAPASCETGSCGTCMARIKEGGARMLNNDALDDDEVAEGWVLTCQSLPTTRVVHVDYED